MYPPAKPMDYGAYYAALGSPVRLEMPEPRARARRGRRADDDYAGFRLGLGRRRRAESASPRSIAQTPISPIFPSGSFA